MSPAPRVRWSVLAGVLASCGPSIGSRCRVIDDCQGIENGYCARAQVCTRRCSEAQVCPNGSACVVADGSRVCLKSCKATRDCNVDEQCRTLDGAQVCMVTDPLKRPI